MMDNTVSAIEKVISTIYCKSIFQDFRRPVEAMFPGIGKDYYAIIKSPMDLGTLLLKVKNGEIAGANDFRRDLQLVHNNAYTFNEGTPVMMAMSKHLEMFSGGMFEELLGEIYNTTDDSDSNEDSNNNSNNNSSSAASLNLIRAKRANRYQSYSTVPLWISEIEAMLKDWYQVVQDSTITTTTATSAAVAPNSTTDASAAIHSASEECEKIMTLFLSKAAMYKDNCRSDPTDPAAASSSSSSSSSSVPTLCLADILAPMARCPCTRNLFGLLVSNDSNSGATSPTSTSTSTLFSNVERAVGVLLVCVEERVMRGSSCSSLWIAPNTRCVWAQPVLHSSKGKASPYYPGMVVHSNSATKTQPRVYAYGTALGGSSVAPVIISTASLHNGVNMIDAVGRQNMTRFPEDVKKQLQRMRPKGRSTSASSAPAATATATAAASLPGLPSIGTVTAAAASSGLSANGSGLTGSSTGMQILKDEGSLLSPRVSLDGSAAAAADSNSTTNCTSTVSPKMDDLSCPEGCILVEFFGGHDFSWVKTENTYLFSSEKMPPGHKTCAASIIAEAVEAQEIINHVAALNHSKCTGLPPPAKLKPVVIEKKKMSSNGNGNGNGNGKKKKKIDDEDKLAQGADSNTPTATGSSTPTEADTADADKGAAEYFVEQQENADEDEGEKEEGDDIHALFDTDKLPSDEELQQMIAGADPAKYLALVPESSFYIGDEAAAEAAAAAAATAAATGSRKSRRSSVGTAKRKYSDYLDEKDSMIAIALQAKPSKAPTAKEAAAAAAAKEAAKEATVMLAKGAASVGGSTYSMSAADLLKRTGGRMPRLYHPNYYTTLLEFSRRCAANKKLITSQIPLLLPVDSSSSSSSNNSSNSLVNVGADEGDDNAAASLGGSAYARNALFRSQVAARWMQNVKPLPFDTSTMLLPNGGKTAGKKRSRKPLYQQANLPEYERNEMSGNYSRDAFNAALWKASIASNGFRRGGDNGSAHNNTSNSSSRNSFDSELRAVARDVFVEEPTARTDESSGGTRHGRLSSSRPEPLVAEFVDFEPPPDLGPADQQQLLTATLPASTSSSTSGDTAEDPGAPRAAVIASTGANTTNTTTTTSSTAVDTVKISSGARSSRFLYVPNTAAGEIKNASPVRKNDEDGDKPAAGNGDSIATPPAVAKTIPPLVVPHSINALQSFTTAFIAGSGVFHTRTVNFSDKLFRGESRTCKKRKAILREELRVLEREIAKMAAAAAAREAIVSSSTSLSTTSSARGKKTQLTKSKNANALGGEAAAADDDDADAVADALSDLKPAALAVKLSKIDGGQSELKPVALAVKRSKIMAAGSNGNSNNTINSKNSNSINRKGMGKPSLPGKVGMLAQHLAQQRQQQQEQQQKRQEGADSADAGEMEISNE